MARHGDLKLLFCILLKTVIFFAVSESSKHHECDRICGENEEPKRCYYSFTIRVGLRKESKLETLTINNESPGPLISVCQNDIIIVDVRNLLPSGLETSIHWHGLPQKGTPHMDGVPMITQCPIIPNASFRYQFKATVPGTYYYHAHSVFQQLDGVFGALVVHSSSEKVRGSIVMFYPRLNHLLSLDANPTAQILVEELHHEKYESDEEDVDGLQKLRIINAAALDCPINIFTHFVHFKVMALDGLNVKQTDISNVFVYPGERIDVLMKRDVAKITRIVGYNLCSGFEKHGLDVLATENNQITPQEKLPENPMDYYQGFQSETDDNLEEADLKIYVPYDYAVFNSSDDVDFRYKLAESSSAYSPPYLSNRDSPIRLPQFGNKSFLYPSSPELTQGDQDFDEITCTSEFNSYNCELNTNGFCECLQILNLPYNKTIDLFLIDEGKHSNATHSFHIHGHKFSLMSIKSHEVPIFQEDIKSKDMSGEIKRNLVNPIQKDTVVVPNKGYAIIRLRTDNPGDWLLESITSKAQYGTGLEIILKVRNPDGNFSPASQFPKCGTFKNPDQIFGD